MQGKEALECCKQSSIGDTGGSSEDQNAKRNVDSKACALEISYGNI
jgi:hypothetical protein